MFFTYSEEIKEEGRQSGRKNACSAPYRSKNRIKFWRTYVILLWTVPSLISSSQLVELLTLYSYLMITGTLNSYALKWPCLFHFIFFIFGSFMHHVGSVTSQRMSMALSQTHHWNSWATQSVGSLAGLNCPSPRQQQPDTAFSPETKISLSKRGECVSWMQHHFCFGSKCVNIFWFKSKHNFPLIVLCKKQDHPNSTEKTWIPEESGLVPKFLVIFFHVRHLLLFVHFLSY